MRHDSDVINLGTHRKYVGLIGRAIARVKNLSLYLFIMFFTRKSLFIFNLYYRQNFK